MDLHEKTNLELEILCEQNNLSSKGGKLDMIARLEKNGISELKTEKPEEKREKRGRPKKK